MAETPRARRNWPVAVVATAGVVAHPASHPKAARFEVSRVVSAEARAAAVLMEVPRDAAGARSFKVCLQRPSSPPHRPVFCNEVAYLAGAQGPGSEPPVRLVWTTPFALEIRYVAATSVHVY